MEDFNNHGFFAPKGPSFLKQQRSTAPNSSPPTSASSQPPQGSSSTRQQLRHQQRLHPVMPYELSSYYQMQQCYRSGTGASAAAQQTPSRFGFPQQFGQQRSVNSNYYSPQSQFGGIQRGNLLHGARSITCPSYQAKPTTGRLVEPIPDGYSPKQENSPPHSQQQPQQDSFNRSNSNNPSYQSSPKSDSQGTVDPIHPQEQNLRCLCLEDKCGGGGDGGGSGIIFGKQAQQQQSYGQTQQKQQFSRSSEEVSPSTANSNKKKRPVVPLPTQIPIQALNSKTKSTAQTPTTTSSNTSTTAAWKVEEELTDEDRFVREFPDLLEANRLTNTRQAALAPVPEQKPQPLKQQQSHSQQQVENGHATNMHSLATTNNPNAQYQQQNVLLMNENGEDNTMLRSLQFRYNVRAGQSQFYKDFDEVNYPSSEVDTSHTRNKFEMYLPAEFNPDFYCKDVRFDIDERWLMDPRPILRSAGWGETQKEFKLFEDHSASELMKKVYNVNSMDLNPMEVCGKKMLPKNVKQWPIQMIGFDDDRDLRKDLLLLKNPSGGAISDSVDPLGDYGLRTLAKSTNFEGAMETPFSFITFMGMNLNKVIRGLDQADMMIQTFAGPFAAHNHSLAYGSVGVTRSIPEYDVPSEDELKKDLQILPSRINQLGFGTLAFIFYNIVGDGLQLLAARALNKRGWALHKLYQVWIKPWKEGDRIVQIKDIDFSDLEKKEIEKGFDETLLKDESYWKSDSYLYFNYETWLFACTRLIIKHGVLETWSPSFDEPLWG